MRVVKLAHVVASFLSCESVGDGFGFLKVVRAQWTQKLRRRSPGQSHYTMHEIVIDTETTGLAPLNGDASSRLVRLSLLTPP